MRTVPYSAAKADLFTPWERADYFSDGESQHTVSLCAELSRLAYCRKQSDRSFDSDKIRSVLATVGFSDCQLLEGMGLTSKSGTHCFTAVGNDPESGKQIGAVVFRGTDADDPTDIGDDADFLLQTWDAGGLVHTGFANALAAIRPGLDDVVKYLGVPIVFTGHSLGAALATLAASLYKPNASSLALYTFGSPRVGNTDFVTTLDGVNVYRYRDCCDVVTRVPLPVMGYAHVAAAHYIDRNGLISLDPSDTAIAEDQAAAESDYLLHYAAKVGNVGLRGLADHALINYVWAVGAAGRS